MVEFEAKLKAVAGGIHNILTNSNTDAPAHLGAGNRIRPEADKSRDNHRGFKPCLLGKDNMYTVCK
jgi:hypothetical protein